MMGVARFLQVVAVVAVVHTHVLTILILGTSCASPTTAAFVPSHYRSKVGRSLSLGETTSRHDARQVLIEKAQEIDESLKTSKTGSYAAAGWSNRLGTVLTPASIPGVYVACRPFYWNRIDVGGRMTVVQLDDGSLWIHSPVALDDALRQALERLGTVQHVVSPNYEHVKYAQQWSEAYPQASFWGCPGMAEREPQVPWTGEIPSGIRPAGYLGGNLESQAETPAYFGFDGKRPLWNFKELQPLHMDCELNPFTGRAFFNEVVFYHVASKSLIVTDLFWNYPTKDGIPNTELKRQFQNAAQNEDYGAWELEPSVDSVPLTSRLWKFGMDRIYAPFYSNLMIPSNRREEYQKIVQHICHEWDTETLVPAHGDIVRGKTLIRQVLTRFFGIP